MTEVETPRDYYVIVRTFRWGKSTAQIAVGLFTTRRRAQRYLRREEVAFQYRPDEFTIVLTHVKGVDPK